jgi:hypothetical protein
LVNFIGSAKEAFMTPAATRRRKPALALSMLKSFSLSRFLHLSAIR